MTLPVELTVDADSTAGFERRVAPLIGDLHRQAMRMTRHHADAEARPRHAGKGLRRV